MQKLVTTQITLDRPEGELIVEVTGTVTGESGNIGKGNEQRFESADVSDLIAVDVETGTTVELDVMEEVEAEDALLALI